MAQFDEEIALALELIQENGQAVTWVRNPESVTDTEEPWKVTPADPINVPGVYIVFLPMDRVGQTLFRALAQSEVQIGSLYGLMGQQSFEPNAKDVVIRDGRTLRINAIDLLSPNGQKILYYVFFDD